MRKQNPWNHPTQLSPTEESLINRIHELEQQVEYLQTDLSLRDDDIRNYLEDIKRLEQRLKAEGGGA